MTTYSQLPVGEAPALPLSNPRATLGSRQGSLKSSREPRRTSDLPATFRAGTQSIVVDQRLGYGARLLAFAEARARELGAREVAVDTAEGAKGLIDDYPDRGHRHVETAPFGHTNHRSVVLSKAYHG